MIFKNYEFRPGYNTIYIIKYKPTGDIMYIGGSANDISHRSSFNRIPPILLKDCLGEVLEYSSGVLKKRVDYYKKIYKNKIHYKNKCYKISKKG